MARLSKIWIKVSNQTSWMACADPERGRGFRPHPLGNHKFTLRSYIEAWNDKNLVSN